VIELVARILLIIPFYHICCDLKNDHLWLILLTFGLISLLFRSYVRLGLIYILACLTYYVINFNTNLELLWLVGGLLILTSNINKRVVEVVGVGEAVKINPKPEIKKDPLDKYAEKESFINWFMGKNNKNKNPPVFFALIYFIIFSPILILISNLLVRY
jgi:hypothetical protein